MKILKFVGLVVLLAIAKSTSGQTIPNVSTMGPALAANVRGSYTSAPGLGSATTVNAPVVGNGEMALIIGGQATALTFDVGKADFWGVEHGVIMPVGSLLLNASSLSGSSYSLIQNVGAATVTGRFTTGNYGLGLNAWVATSENTAFIQLTNTGSQSLTFTSQLRDGYGTTGNPGTLGYSTSSTWLNVSPDAVYLELGNHMNISTNAPLQGRIADMQIFNQALSPAQLNALETPGAVPCLLQWAATNTGTASLRGTASLNTSDPHGGSVVLTGDASSEVAVGVMGMPQTQFTVSAWVYLSAISSSKESCIFAGLVNHGTTGYPFMRGFKLVVLPNGALSASLNTSGSAGTGQWDGFAKDAVNTYAATASGSMPLNQWIQTAVTYDGNALTIYTNGTAVGVTTNFPSAAQVAGLNKMAIHLGDTNSPFKGCAPQGALVQSVFGVSVTDNGSTLTFTVPAGGQATIALAAVTDRNTNNFLAAAQQQSQGANASSMSSLYQAHNQWWSNFWSKSFVQISDQLVQNEWYASLYLLACSSRSNCPPPGLWGNYITSTGMYWEGDYTLDYNVQATFWCALACNHPELTDNYDQLLLDHISRGQATAQHWGYQGIYLYTHLIPFPGWSDDGYTFWSQKSGALFAAVNCVMRWRYTSDTNYAARVYPYVKGVSDFWDNYLVLSNNRYVDNTDAAAESGYTTDVNPATTLAFIQLVYPALIQMSQALNVDAGRRAKWSDIVARLSPLTIVSANSISSLAALTNYVTPGMNVIRDTSSGTDFPTPMVALYQDHQARGSSAGMNSTQTIFPGWDIGLESDPVTLAAASNTVYLAAEWYDNNDCSTFYPSAAAIGYDPSQILANLDAAITYHANPNFMFVFPGGGTENYSIVPCALANMFLQSYQTNLHIFPNWPANQNASFGNLNACGGFLVSSAMTNSLIPYVQITSTAGQQLRLLNPWPQLTVQVVSTVNPTTQFTGNIFTYQTQVGEVLTLTPAQTSAPPAPVGLAATAGIERAVLNWTATSNTMSYNVKRSTVSGGPYTNVAIVRTTSCTDTGLTGGTGYYYVVSALNLSGESANSAEAGVSPTANVPYPWMAQDIGSVGVAGSESLSNGLFTVTASGDDIWNAADACRFVCLPVTGDCTIVARVAFVQNADSWSKAGMMIRGSLAASVANAFIAVTPGYGVTWQYRSSDGGTSGNNNTTGFSAPYWVKLVRSGNTFSGYRSPDGTNWTQQGASQTLTVGSTAYVGLAVTSHNNSSLCTATFDNVTAPGWPPPAPPTPSGLAAASGVEQAALSWTGSLSASSYNVKRSTINGGPYTIVASVSTTNCLDTGLLGGTTYYYVVSAVNAGGESANSAQGSAIPATVPKLAGTIIGTAGSYNSSGNTISNVFDNNLSTFFDGPNSSNGNGCWVGLDFGASVSNVIMKINYCPRSGFESRMVGGIFLGANQAEFSDAVVLYTVGTQPASGVFTSALIANTAAFRYVRYLSPNGGWGNVSELEFYGYPPSIPAPVPTGLSAVAASSSQINLTWNALGSATSYNVKRSMTSGGPYAIIATGLTVTNYSDSGLAGGTPCYYVVSAIVSGNETPNGDQAWAATVSPTVGSLTHRYSFLETGGANVADSVGGPIWTGTLPNGGTFSAGQLTLSSNASQYVLLPTGIMSPLSNFTIEVWAKLNTTANGNRLFDIGNSTSDYMFLTPQSGSTSKLRFGINTPGNAEQDINGLSALSTGVWSHVAVTLNGNWSVLYQNGIAVGTNSYVTNNPVGMGNTINNWIGRSEFSTTTYLDGVLDEFRIYNAALSPAEIAATYALGPDQTLGTGSPPMSLVLTETNLTMSWPLANAGFTLQSRTNLLLGDWVNVTLVMPQIVGSQWQIVLPQPTGDVSTFYRLAK